MQTEWSMLGKQKYKNYLYTLVLLGYQLDLIHQILLEYPNKQNKGINKQRDTIKLNNILILLMSKLLAESYPRSSTTNNWIRAHKSVFEVNFDQAEYSDRKVFFIFIILRTL